MERKPLAPKLRQLIHKARYKTLYGGRGSGKSWGVAELLIEISRMSCVGILCTRELQKSIEESVYKLLANTIIDKSYTQEFDIKQKKITHLISGSYFVFFGLKNNPQEIKSLEGIDIVWCEEAQNISDTSWNILIPTIRKPNSEIWLTFNPLNMLDATYQRFVINPPRDSIVIKMNYYDNPHFPETLRLEMEECKAKDEDLHRHIWLGEPVGDSENAFIKPSWIHSAVDAHIKLNFKASGSKIIGFDVADEGSDDNCIIVRHGSIVYHCETWNLGDVISSANKVNKYAETNSVDKIIYDNIGVGAGVKAQFNRISKIPAIGFTAGGKVYRPEQQFTAGKKNADMFANLKAQAWWNVRQRFENTWLAINKGYKFTDDELISFDSKLNELDYLVAELSRPRLMYDRNDRVIVESKKDMLKRGIKSPNRADSLIMAFANNINAPLVIPKTAMAASMIRRRI